MRVTKKEKKLFMLDSFNDGNSLYAIDHIYDVPNNVAKRMLDEGAAVEVGSIPELEQYQRAIKNAVGQFRREYDKYAKSKDPRYKDAEFFASIVAELKEELEETVDEAQADYSAVLKATRLAAEQERANVTRVITPNDKAGAEQLMSELVTEAKLGGLEGALKRLESDMQYFTAGRKAALSNELHRLVDLVPSGDSYYKRKLRVIKHKLHEDANGVERAARMANAIPDSITYPFLTLKLTHRAYK